MTRPIKDLTKSVHTRLLTLAKRTGRPFNEVLQLYAMERFLYRLSRSKHSTSFVLKGGLMLRVWKAPVTRPTKDVDLLGRTKNTVANLVSIVEQVCNEPVEPDGIWLLAQTFDFRGDQLAHAVKATFATRTTKTKGWPMDLSSPRDAVEPL